MNLREFAQEFPFCCYCGTPNYDGHQLCLCHSNALRDGRGHGFKSKDLYGAYGCHECHEKVDGRKGGLSKEEKRGMHEKAWRVFIRWLIDNDRLEVK